MRYAYYPGCSMHSATAREYESSLLAVSALLGLDLQEVDDWYCCGSGAAHSVSKLLAATLPLGNLASSRRMGLDRVVVPCPSCLARFKAALFHVEHEPELSAQVKEVVEGDYRAKVYHPLQLLSHPDALAAIAAARKPIPPDWKVACYYGCLLTRPPKLAQFDDVENPHSMDDVLRAAGFPTVDWPGKTNCCGAALTLTRKDVVVKLCHDILQEAKESGADAIAVACPMCQVNLDTRQEEIEARYGDRDRLPILYFTQLLAVAFGLSREVLMFEKHMVVPGPTLTEVAFGDR